MKRLPSIRGRLARSLVAWSVLWSLAMAAAVWLAASKEVDELLDDTLQSSAIVLASLMAQNDLASHRQDPGLQPRGESGRFSWQLVDAHGALLMRSGQAPGESFHAQPRLGFSRSGQWRVFGSLLNGQNRMLYVAHTLEERREAQAEVALGAALSSLAIGLLGHIWLRVRARQELRPLQTLSEALARHEPLEASLGPAEREELQPVHAAIDDLGRRLARRLAHERAFTAHAAHSLRTPLAGIDAQLAMALRESPPGMAPRLQRVREAAGRLRHVVEALLSLFRSGAELQREPIDMDLLLARLPIEGLDVDVEVPKPVDADPDLLSAALINLLDNALRHGAKRVRIEMPQAGVVRVHDDGPGVPPERRLELQDALSRQDYEDHMGLGLMLADMVARSHGGRLVLPQTAAGFAVDLVLPPKQPVPASGESEHEVLALHQPGGR